jgi:hypothetical protein
MWVTLRVVIVHGMNISLFIFVVVISINVAGKN